jgi:hypothetical protein
LILGILNFNLRWAIAIEIGNNEIAAAPTRISAHPIWVIGKSWVSLDHLDRLTSISLIKEILRGSTNA